MSINALIILIILFFVTSAIGVVTGSNSLVTVPVMFQFGMEPKIAVATNMFGLAFMSIGASIPFFQEGYFDRKTLSPLLILTILGSMIGAFLVGSITNQSLRIIVSVSMICVALFTLFRRNAGLERVEKVAQGASILVLTLTFLLGIYGGLFSGGYTTMLTTVLVGLFGMTFTEAVASTKFINIASSSIASAVFAWQGLIDYKIGFILAVTMFIGAYIGAQTVTKLNDLWLRRIFLTTVLILAVKTIYDFISN